MAAAAGARQGVAPLSSVVVPGAERQVPVDGRAKPSTTSLSPAAPRPAAAPPPSPVLPPLPLRPPPAAAASRFVAAAAAPQPVAACRCPPLPRLAAAVRRRLPWPSSFKDGTAPRCCGRAAAPLLLRAAARRDSLPFADVRRTAAARRICRFHSRRVLRSWRRHGLHRQRCRRDARTSTYIVWQLRPGKASDSALTACDLTSVLRGVLPGRRSRLRCGVARASENAGERCCCGNRRDERKT
jgi:hypothetical protein